MNTTSNSFRNHPKSSISGWYYYRGTSTLHPPHRPRSLHNSSHHHDKQTANPSSNGAITSTTTNVSPPLSNNNNHFDSTTVLSTPEDKPSLLFSKDWSATERDAFTHHVLDVFVTSNDSTGPFSFYNSRKRQHHNNNGGGVRGRNNNSTTTSSSSSSSSFSSSSSSSSSSLLSSLHGPQREVVHHLIAGNFEESFLNKYSTSCLNWSISKLGQLNRYTLAEQLFHWMRVTRRANEHTFVKFCEACEYTKRYIKPLQTWRNLRRFHQGSETMGGIGLPTMGAHAAAALLKPFRAAGDLGGMLSTLKELRHHGVVVNRWAYNICLRACADVGALDQAMEIFHQLRELGQIERQEQQQGGRKMYKEAGEGGVEGEEGDQQYSSNNIELGADQRTYSALLSTISSSKKWSRTMTIYKHMMEDGIALDKHLLLQLLHCFAGAGRWEAAQWVMNQCLLNSNSNSGGGNSISNSNSNSNSNSGGSYSSSASSLATPNNNNGHYNHDGRMGEPVFNLSMSYDSVDIETFEDRGVVGEEDGSGGGRSSSTNTRNNNNANNNLSPSPPPPPSASSAGAAVRPRQPRPNRTHWNALLSAYAEGRQYTRCMLAYTQMTEVHGHRPDAYTLVAILRASFHAKRGPAAAEWAQSQAVLYNVPLTVQLGTAMICTCRHPGTGDGTADGTEGESVRVARSVFDRMKKMSSNNNNSNGNNSNITTTTTTGRRRTPPLPPTSSSSKPNIVTYNSLMLVHAAVGDYSGVLDIYKELEESDDDDIIEPNDATFTILIKVCEEAGWEEKGREFEELRKTWATLMS